jgi:large subunit ribosomal protein L24
MAATLHAKNKLKIRRGDTVEVIAGKDVGRRGNVLEVRPDERRVIVENVNMARRHSRPRPVRGTRGAQMTPGGVIDIAAPLAIDNVALVCPNCDKPTRVGYGVDDAGKKIRVCRNAGCGKDISG